MSAITIREDVTVDFGDIQLSGSLEHDDQNRTLVLMTDEGDEHISTILLAYGITPEPGNVFIKDWSEHEGLTERLESAGLVKRVSEVTVGPFSSRAYEVKITI